MVKAKPFMKWVGGKGQLIPQLDAHLPADFKHWKHATYVEPFVGGGAMLFHMLQRYPHIQHAVINDINPDLVTCYRTVRDRPRALIIALNDMAQAYEALPSEPARRSFFLDVRKRYNANTLDAVDNTAHFLFLNKTCFNGLYRVNKKGKFNVPFGAYVRPTICNVDTILRDSELLQRVEVLHGDFEATMAHVQGRAFFYFDPPYRPLSTTARFTHYASEAFNDQAQVRLKAFCDRIHTAGYLFMLSNADCKGANAEDDFFDRLYQDYRIQRVWASRSINVDPSKRGKLTELLVCNYWFCK